MNEYFDNRNGKIWIDGGLQEWSTAKLHVLSHGLHYAQSVFEGERVYNGRVFELARHTQRLLDSAAILGFQIPYSVEELTEATNQLVEVQGIRDGYVRPIAWLGSETMGIAPFGAKTHVAIATWSWPDIFSSDARSVGIRLAIAKWRRPAPLSSPVQAKASGLYTICVMSRREAEEQGFDDALLLDIEGRPAEATGANLFVVKSGRVYTPPTEYVLNGITRQVAIKLLASAGIAVEEVRFSMEHLLGADEVFLTGTAYEIQPVRGIEEQQFRAGEITRKLVNLYAHHVRREPAA